MMPRSTVERRFTAEEAVALLNQFGLEPLEPYSGNMAKTWECRCMHCGQIVHPRLNSAYVASWKNKGDRNKCGIGHGKKNAQTMARADDYCI